MPEDHAARGAPGSQSLIRQTGDQQLRIWDGHAQAAVPVSDPGLSASAYRPAGPLGLNGTVTQGIVSATGRTVPQGQGSSAVLIGAIQTSAAINPATAAVRWLTWRPG